MYGCKPYVLSMPARRTLTKQPRARRFDARLNEEQKTLIQRAADLEGRTTTDFVLHGAQAAAEHAIAERTMLVLTARQSEDFVDSILNPAVPEATLKRAARHYKKQYQS